MSARFLRDTQTLAVASSNWVGKPQNDNEIVYALFENTSNDVLSRRWYVYGNHHDAICIKEDQIPEAVRLARMLIE